MAHGTLKDTTSEMDKVIGQAVRKERLAQGMSQKKLGEALGVTFQQVQKYEEGSNRIATSTCILISRALGLASHALFIEASREIDNAA